MAFFMRWFTSATEQPSIPVFHRFIFQQSTEKLTRGIRTCRQTKTIKLQIRMLKYPRLGSRMAGRCFVDLG